MSLTPALIRWLQTDDAAVWLVPLTANPPEDADLLTSLTRLRRDVSVAQAAALVETARLRHQPITKFPDSGGRMFFTKQSLQQASAAVVASHTANRFTQYQWVVDWGCGLGDDSLALAQKGLNTLAVDQNPQPTALVAANVGR